MTVFSGHNLTCLRGERLVFKGLSFDMDAGDAFVLIGPNGSGKSSLLRLLAGLLKPMAGELRWKGEAVDKEPEEHRARLHYVGHHDAVKPVLTVEENLSFWARLRADEEEAASYVAEAMDVFDIAFLADVPGRFLSAGQKRRVNLARILAARAPVWLLDEPTTALDKNSIKKLEAAMDKHRNDGGMIILSDPYGCEPERPSGPRSGRLRHRARSGSDGGFADMSRFLHLVKRDLRLALRQGSDNVMVVMFFVLCVVLFPFGVGPEPNILARIAAGVIWVGALLASMLSLERLFQTDYEDGSLELLTLTPTPLEIVVLAKIFAHWLTTGLPLIAASPLLAVLLNMNEQGFGVLLLALLLGTPSLSLIGSVGAALVLGARRGGVLISLLVLPLYVPVLIFGVSAVDAAIGGFEIKAQLMILGALFVGALPLCPWGAAAALRQSME